MSKWSHVEKALVVLGLIGIDVWLVSNAEKAIYQAWEGWVFDQQLQGRSGDMSAFLSQKEAQFGHWLGIEGHQPAVSAPRAPAPPTVRAPETANNAPQTPKPVEPVGNAVIGRLSIPRLRLTAIIREGVGEDTLRVALGHIPATALPGQTGNVGIAGHRDTLFRALRRIHKNDVISLQTLGGTYTYRVQATKIVGPREVSVLDSTSSPELTLVTCYPFYYVGSAPERFIVKARQEPARS